MDGCSGVRLLQQDVELLFVDIFDLEHRNKGVYVLRRRHIFFAKTVLTHKNMTRSHVQNRPSTFLAPLDYLNGWSRFEDLGQMLGQVLVNAFDQRQEFLNLGAHLRTILFVKFDDDA